MALGSWPIVLGPERTNRHSFAFHSFLVSPDVRLIEGLIDAGCPVDVRHPVRGGGWMVYQVARLLTWAKKRPPMLAKFVHETGAMSGSPSCLHAAAFTCHLGALKLLLESGVDVDVRSYHLRRTPLHVAAAFGHREIARTLVAAGASIGARDRYNRTPQELAARHGHAELATDLHQASWDRHRGSAASSAGPGAAAEQAPSLGRIAARVVG